MVTTDLTPIREHLGTAAFGLVAAIKAYAKGQVEGWHELHDRRFEAEPSYKLDEPGSDTDINWRRGRTRYLRLSEESGTMAVNSPSRFHIYATIAIDLQTGELIWPFKSDDEDYLPAVDRDIIQLALMPQLITASDWLARTH